MKKTFHLVILIFLFGNVYSQTEIDWSLDYQLKFSDFEPPGVQIGNGNMYSLYSGATFGFSFQMSSYQYMFTRKFNDKIACYFNKQSASLNAPDSLIAGNLLAYAQFSFDLSELYARKFRKEIYENKSTFSSNEIFKEAFDKWQNEYAKRFAEVGQQTDIGQNTEELELLHQEVLNEIEELSEFCKTCKPKKKKKKSKK